MICLGTEGRLMAIDFLERCDIVEECYEFLLGYAAQGLPNDHGSPAGREVRSQRNRPSVLN